MKLKICKNIEVGLHTIKFVVLLPLLPIGIAGKMLYNLFTKVYDTLDGCVWKISNKLLRNCDEVKNGTIKIPVYKHLTSKNAYIWLKNEIKKEKGD